MAFAFCQIPHPPPQNLASAKNFTTHFCKSRKHLKRRIIFVIISWDMEALMALRKIDVNDPEGIYDIAAELMDEYKCGFSVILDGDYAAERRGEQRKYTEGFSGGWTKLCSILRKGGNGGIVNEIEYLENNMMVKCLGGELWRCYNDGDVEGMKVATSGINGIMAIMKGSFSKIDVDRKNSELALKMRAGTEKLDKYDTEKLEDMLRVIREVETDGDK